MTESNTLIENSQIVLYNLCCMKAGHSIQVENKRSQRFLPMILFGATPMRYNLRHLLLQRKIKAGWELSRTSKHTVCWRKDWTCNLDNPQAVYNTTCCDLFKLRDSTNSDWYQRKDDLLFYQHFIIFIFKSKFKLTMSLGASGLMYPSSDLLKI